MAGSLNRATGSRVGLLVAGVAVLLLEHFVPFGGLILYPFTLLATWVHEMGHGLGAIIAGGHFAYLEINGDASGLALTTSIPGWHAAWVCAAGLLAPPFAGATILASARGPKRSGAILMTLSLAMSISILLWVRSSVGIISMAPLAGVLAALAF